MKANYINSNYSSYPHPQNREKLIGNTFNEQRTLIDTL